ncbi:ethylene-responsive transcription factor ERF017 [Eucalyptus grandis]|uniref:ethylene-responsive transcription factor ERF017 n=1 Tax=Eucalyptus grandis TaxID=71139 RepID=UPI00192ED3BA|nr:ethylene-responsive transcription factor ERF017 [Eucalyptus grandis]
MTKRSEAKAAAVHEGEGARSELKFRGVRKRKWGRWVSEIRLPNSRERIWLGSYDTPEKAARAFDAAAFCLGRPAAKLNFPGSPPEISGAASLSPDEIQSAAASHANFGAVAVPARAELPRPGSPAPSPSVSASEASSVLTTESDLTLDLSFLDFLDDSGPVSGEPHIGKFPGVEEAPDVFYHMQFPSVESAGLNLDTLLASDSFPWRI